jgi:hypothetical protein
MALDAKRRFVVVGALLGATVVGVQLASAQTDMSGTTQVPGTQPSPGALPQTTVQPTIQPPTFSTDAGVGGSGFPTPSPFGTPDAGIGGSGPPLPSPFSARDGGF